MSSADIEDNSESKFFIVHTAALPEPGAITLPEDFIDHAVHVLSPPQLSDLRRSFSLLPRFMPLFTLLIWRLIRLRYTQSYLGLIWVVVQPITQAAIILFLFTLINVHTADGAHQGLFLFAGVTTWGFFARGLGDTQGSLNTHAGILTKVYMPKIMLPLASIIATWLDTVIIVSMLIVTCFAFGIPPSMRLLWLPVFLTLISFASLSIGLGLAPLNALYRDFGVFVPLVLQVVMYLSPVYYATRFIPPKYQLPYHLNPMVSLLEGVRWSILPDSPAPSVKYLLINIVCLLGAFSMSLIVYQKLESTVIDRI